MATCGIQPRFYIDLKQRIMSQVEDTNAYAKDCWKWKGCTTTDGRYGRVHLYISGESMHVTAHKFIHYNIYEVYRIMNVM